MLEGKLGIRAHRNATLKSSRPSLISLTDCCHRSTSMCSSTATSSPTYCSRMASVHSAHGVPDMGGTPPYHDMRLDVDHRIGHVWPRRMMPESSHALFPQSYGAF